MTWVLSVLFSVALFVSGMLSLVKAERNHASFSKRTSPSPSAYPIGVSANITMSVVSVILAAVFVTLSQNFRENNMWPLLYREHERRNVLPWLVLFGTLFFLGNMVYFDGLVKAPNAGYARALMTVEIVILTFLTAWIFGYEIGAVQIAGIVLVTVGAVLVSW